MDDINYSGVETPNSNNDPFDAWWEDEHSDEEDVDDVDFDVMDDAD